MKSADILYLPLPDGSYSATGLPGKIFEYVGSGRRIIASAQEGSEVRHLLAAVGHYRAVLPKDIEGLAQVLQTLMHGDEAGLFTARNEQAAAAYERSAQAAMLARVLDSCAAVAAGP